MSFWISVLVSVGFALFGFPYRHYECWFSFAKWSTVIGIGLYLALAGGGGGVLGWGVAMIGNAHPTANEAVNGLLYGITGALAFRADFKTRKSVKTGKKSSQGSTDLLRDARSALTASITWTVEFLDERTYRKAKEWLGSMSDQELILAANDVQSEIVNPGRHAVSDKTRDELCRLLVPAMEQLSDLHTKAEGRAHLVTFCASYYRTEHLPKNRPLSADAQRRYQVV